MLSQFISAKDVHNLDLLLQKCFEVKKNPFAETHLGKNKCLGLAFFNPSQRTRMSTQRAATNLGLSVICLNLGSDRWKLEMEDGTIMDGDSQEHFKDVVRVMGSYCDILGERCFPGLKNQHKDYSEEFLNQFVHYSEVPVVNLESAILHSFQPLADLMTVEEVTKLDKPKIVLSLAPHPRVLPQAVSNSFLQWAKM